MTRAAWPESGREKKASFYPENIHGGLPAKSVTLRFLWQKYKQVNPDGYQYSQFCYHYQQCAKLDVCLRQTYRAGEKLFVDYAGQSESWDAYLFVATRGHRATPMSNRALPRICRPGSPLMFEFLISSAVSPGSLSPAIPGA